MSYSQGAMYGHHDSLHWNEEIYGTPYFSPSRHASSWTHEAIADAAGFEAMKYYEEHLRASGEQPSHHRMKEILAGYAAAEVERLIESRGIHHLERERLRRLAVDQALFLAGERYGPGETGVEYVRTGGSGPSVVYGAPGYSYPAYPTMQQAGPQYYSEAQAYPMPQAAYGAPQAVYSMPVSGQLYQSAYPDSAYVSGDYPRYHHHHHHDHEMRILVQDY